MGLLVVDMFPFVVDMCPEEVIVSLVVVVMIQTVAIGPVVGVLPAADIANC